MSINGRTLNKSISEDITSSPNARVKASQSPCGPRRPLKGLTFGAAGGGGRKQICREGRSDQHQIKSFMSQPTGSIITRERSVSCEQEERELRVKARMGTLIFQGKSYVIENLDDMCDITRIGSGISGEVFKMTFGPIKRSIAAKKMVWHHEKWEEQRRVLMDVEVMNSHHSPNIVEYYGSAIVNNEVWVFMEQMETCLDVLMNRKLKGPIPEQIICKMCVPILKALNYLKTEHQVIHRDVKPSNVLVDKAGNVKLCDFGISGRLVDSKAFTKGAGCAAYMAPERISTTQSSGYDVRADVWSLGVSLVELANGVSPYAGDNFKSEFHLLAHIVQAPPPLLDKEKFSENFYDFVAQCLSKDVKVRPVYPQLLTHPLIIEYEKRPIDIGKWVSDVCMEYN